MCEEQPQILRLRLAEKRPNSAQDDNWIYDADFGDRTLAFGDLAREAPQV
jgi:hypothetical protein